MGTGQGWRREKGRIEDGEEGRTERGRACRPPRLVLGGVGVGGEDEEEGWTEHQRARRRGGGSTLARLGGRRRWMRGVKNKSFFFHSNKRSAG